MTDAWPPAAVARLLASDQRFQRVPVDRDYARTVLEDVASRECDMALYAASKGDWLKANTESYDAARKAVEALLLAHGWRVAAGPGAHAAVGEAVRQWLGHQPPPGPRIADKFQASRKARHDDEYPHPRSRARTATELRELTLDNVRLVNLARELLDLSPRPELLPTAENLETFEPRRPPR